MLPTRFTHNFGRFQAWGWSRSGPKREYQS
jgi:hypothetical protein